MNPLNDKLRQITLEAFESLCRLFPEMEGNESAEAPYSEAVAVEFSGPVRGIFYLYFQSRLRRAVAEAMLESAPTTQQEEDAMKEMANVICGNMLPYVVGPEPVFTLSPPRRESLSEKRASTETTVSTQVIFPQGAAEMSVFLYP